MCFHVCASQGDTSHTALCQPAPCLLSTPNRRIVLKNLLCFSLRCLQAMLVHCTHSRRQQLTNDLKAKGEPEQHQNNLSTVCVHQTMEIYGLLTLCVCLCFCKAILMRTKYLDYGHKFFLISVICE